MFEGMMRETSRKLNSFWLVKYETGECFIYHETALRQLDNDISLRLIRMASGRKIVITNQGHGLDRTQLDKDIFRVFVKTVEPFFGKDERNARLTNFERGFNVNQFLNHVQGENGATRAIIKVQTPFPSITSRISVKGSDITYVSVTEIEVACLDLENMILTMTDALRRKDINELYMRLQGGIFAGVNGGLMNTVERYLDASQKGDAHTAELTVMIRQIFDLLTRGVTTCSEYQNSTSRPDLLKSLPRGLEVLKSKCQPYLMG
jgi:hypothetical protein